MSKSRWSRNLLVGAAMMGVFQAGLLFAAHQIRPQRNLPVQAVSLSDKTVMADAQP